MTATFYIFLGLLLSIIPVIYLLKKKSYSSSGWMGFGLSWVILVPIGLFIFFVICSSNNKSVEWTHNHLELISLENGSEMIGEIHGGGSFLGNSFSGSLGNEAFCTFIVKNKSGDIFVRKEPTSKITFRESESYYAEEINHNFIYHMAFTKKKRDAKYYFAEQNTFIIYIKKQDIKSYVKFN